MSDTQKDAYAKRTIIKRSKLNSLAPGKFEWNFRNVIFKQILVIDGWGISCEIALTWMSLDFTDDQSTLVQVMAWCRQATSHCLSQCWPRSLSPYGITRPCLYASLSLNELNNCLLPKGTKPKTVLTYHQYVQLNHFLFKIPITKMCLKTTYSKLQSQAPMS